MANAQQLTADEAREYLDKKLEELQTYYEKNQGMSFGDSVCDFLGLTQDALRDLSFQMVAVTAEAVEQRDAEGTIQSFLLTFLSGAFLALRVHNPNLELTEEK